MACASDALDRCSHLELLAAAHDAVPQAGAATPPSAWLQQGPFPTALGQAAAARGAAGRLADGGPAGDTLLRERLAQHLSALDIVAAPGQIVTTLGATHALDIVRRSLLAPGDAVMVEEPTSPMLLAQMACAGIRILSVPRGPAGPDLPSIERHCVAHAPRLYVSLSVLHNPTGACLPPQAAHRILGLAARFGFHVLEDDSFGGLAAGHASRMAAMDGLRRTIHVGGFSAVMGPGCRVGFIAASPTMVDRLVASKWLTTQGTPPLPERALAACLAQAALEDHLSRLRKRIDVARARSVAHAAAAGFRFTATAGPFGWMDTGVDTDALARRAQAEGYRLAPGRMFQASGTASTWMRVNFAATAQPSFWTTLRQLRAG